ncbi:hypothetical protein [Bacteroides intestinalis]|jgi:hypothetical protein|nr:hypothetical protein [Bacteroides intestinalis]MBS6563556.1 hypothetical protein [Staphylococcus sp.]
MKNLNENAMMQEMAIDEMKDTNGGQGIAIPGIIILELLQKAYDAITNE